MMKVKIDADAVGELRTQSVEKVKEAMETGSLTFELVEDQVEEFLDRVEAVGQMKLPTEYEQMFERMMKNCKVSIEAI